MITQIKECQNLIRSWTEVRKIPEEIKAAKEELKKYERNMLGTMVGIFGIFVAIFSLVLISANTVVQIESGEGIGDIVMHRFAYLLPVFAFLLLLLYLSIWAIKR